MQKHFHRKEKKKSIFNAMEGLGFLFARESRVFWAIRFCFSWTSTVWWGKGILAESVFIIFYFHTQDTDFKVHSINARFQVISSMQQQILYWGG